MLSRIRAFNLTIHILFTVLIGAMGYLQIFKGEFYRELSIKNYIRLVPDNAPRGKIYASGNEVMADNFALWRLAVIPQEARGNLDHTILRISEMSGIAPESLHKRYRRRYEAPFIPVVLIDDITKESALAFLEHSSDLPGVLISAVSMRRYPQGQVGAHILGYLGLIDAKEYEQLVGYGYRFRDMVGKNGIEKTFDNYLKGKSGGLQIKVDNLGREVEVLGKKPPVEGKDLHLTINMELQKLLSKMMEGRKGAVIVLNAETGALLSLVSTPSFDPNIFVHPKHKKARNKVLRSKFSPLLNRAIGGEYPLGSVFKLIAAAAGLVEHIVNPHTQFFCSGYMRLGGLKFNCWYEEGHGQENIVRAITHSCNVYFYRLGLLLGVDTLSEWAGRFGLGRRTGVELPGERRGFVPTKRWKLRAKKERWYDGETVNLVIGQGYLLVTPIQAVRIAAAIANGGELVRPYLVERIEGVNIASIRKESLHIPQESLQIIRNGMLRCVSSDEGTGQRARVEGVKIGGKTGTAQVSGKLPHAWFVGFAELKERKIAFAVLIEEGKKGGGYPAEIAKEIIQNLYLSASISL